MMKVRWLMLFSILVLIALTSPLQAAKAPQLPQDVGFTTLQDAANPGHSLLLPFAIEGLTGDASGNLYTTGRQTDPTKKCPVWKFSISGINASKMTVGFIPNGSGAAACNPSGITFDAAGNLYIADAGSGGNVRKVTPDSTGCASDASDDPSCANVLANHSSTDYATNVPGTNGLAFDRNGNLWTGDGTTGQGRVWKIGPGGGANCAPGSEINCVEAFRVQPMRNGTALGGDVTAPVPPAVTPANQGVGRQNNTFPHTAAGGNPQDLVANGVAFDHEGSLFVIDTARGALWKVQFDKAGNIVSPTGCDTTFTDNTLCLSNVFVAHPILEGGDGIALDVAGNVWVDANERQAVAVVTSNGRVVEIFRNPVNSETGLRNNASLSTDDATTAAAKNSHILEFPTSPFLLGKVFCTAQSDGNRRDNFPQSGGEINAASGPARGKISCMTDPQSGNFVQLNIPGLPLPVH